jgi:hypothetical protein
MLHIRRDQMAFFGAQMRRRYVDEEIARVRRERPEQAARVDDAQIRAFIERAIAGAAAHGLVGVSDVQRYTDLHFRLGPDFESSEEHAAVRRLLEDRAVSGQLRLDRIDRLLG